MPTWIEMLIGVTLALIVLPLALMYFIERWILADYLRRRRDRPVERVIYVKDDECRVLTVYDWAYNDPKTGRQVYARTPAKAGSLLAEGVAITPVYTIEIAERN